jgi:hypothetical protein
MITPSGARAMTQRPIAIKNCQNCSSSAHMSAHLLIYTDATRGTRSAFSARCSSNSRCTVAEPQRAVAKSAMTARNASVLKLLHTVLIAGGVLSLQEHAAPGTPSVIQQDDDSPRQIVELSKHIGFFVAHSYVIMRNKAANRRQVIEPQNSTAKCTSPPGAFGNRCSPGCPSTKCTNSSGGADGAVPSMLHQVFFS